MSFLRRNKDENDKKTGARVTPTADSAPMIDPNTGLPPPYEPPTPSVSKDAPKGNIFQRLGNYLVDSYNGLYKIVLEPSMPTKQSVLLMVLGVIIGMIFAYGIFPTEFVGASPYRMNQDAIDQWVKTVAVGYERQVAYSEEEVIKLLNQLPNPRQTIDRLAANTALSQGDLAAVQAIQNLPGVSTVTGTPAPSQELSDSIFQIVLPVVLVLIVTPIVVLLWRLLIYDNIVAPIINQIRRARDPELRATQDKAKKDLQTLQEQKRIKEEMAKNVVADAEFGAPVMQTISIYTKGRNYDDSFAIELGEDQGNQFLGECGVSIATKVGDEVQSLEFWGFDMASQATLTKIFAVPSAITDPTLQAKLAPRLQNPATDIIAAQPGAILNLETDAIRIQGEIATIAYNDAGGTPNSGIENMQLKISAWQKQGSPVGVPAGGAPPIPPPQPLPDYSNMQFDPPPQMPLSSPPPAGGRSLDEYDNIQFDPQPPAGGRTLDEYDNIQFDPPPQMPAGQPLQPPPLQMPPAGINPLSPPPLQMPYDDEDEEDDPFGGTGDFTPLS